MLTRRGFTFSGLSLLSLVACGAKGAGPTADDNLQPGVPGLELDPAKVEPITKLDAEWRAALSPQAYNVLREEGTEIAFTGRYWDEHRPGKYLCAGCGLLLFDAADKFDSGTGWPSFSKPYKPEFVRQAEDASHGMLRSEVECARCGGHLGHVFDDGPKPTGLRYCMNSVSLVFRPKA